MRNPALSLVLGALLFQFSPVGRAAPAELALPTRAEDTRPVSVGSPAPDAELRSLAGDPVRLSSFYGESPLALIFYRGGW